MGIKDSNEITVRLKCDLEELYSILESKGFYIVDEFTIEDSYFIPYDLNIKSLSEREILSKAVLVRYIDDKTTKEEKKKITFKRKEFDIDGNILNQESISCDIKKTEDAKKLLVAIGYKLIMNIKEKDIVYSKDEFEIAIKNIENGDKLIEVETVPNNSSLETIEKIKERLLSIDIPIYTDSFFVKKAEIELKKIIDKNK